MNLGNILLVFASKCKNTLYPFSSSACSLPLYESSGRCVETCPNGEFGNGNEASLTGVCQQCEYY